MREDEEDLVLEVETNKQRKIPSDSCVACARFCGLPLVVLMSFAVLYQVSTSFKRCLSTKKLDHFSYKKLVFIF